MRTNQLMTRDNISEIQRTKDRYFNATTLLDWYNELNPLNKKTLILYKQTPAFKELITYLKENKQIESPYISGKGRKAITWMHPFLFIDFAMYLSVEFKVTVIEWVWDGLIKNRHMAGDYYNIMMKAVLDNYYKKNKTKPPATTYIKEADIITTISKINKPRNAMNEKELAIIGELEKQNTYLLKTGLNKKARIKKLKQYKRYIINGK